MSEAVAPQATPTEPSAEEKLNQAKQMHEFQVHTMETNQRILANLNRILHVGFYPGSQATELAEARKYIAYLHARSGEELKTLRGQEKQFKKANRKTAKDKFLKSLPTATDESTQVKE